MDAENISASTVPSDILSLIFEHTLLSPEGDCESTFVVVLASVCHSWRVTCIDAPNLWSCIDYFTHSYDIVRLFLQRSRNSPLSIDYNEDGKDERILPLLAQESERWLEVRLVVPPPFYPLLSSIRGCLPLLRTLIWGHSSSEAQESFGGFEIAPALVRFSFNSPYLKRSFPLPWIQLTYLSCSDIPSSNLYTMLLNMPRLIQLRIFQVYNDSIDESVIPDGHVFTLASLKVTDCDFQMLHSILRRLPSLGELTIVISKRVKMRDCSTPIMLPYLSSLHIQVDGYLPNLAQSFVIHAPMLYELECICNNVMYYDDDDDDDDDDDNDDDDNDDEELPPVWFVGSCGPAMLGFLTVLVKDASCVLTSLKLDMSVEFGPRKMESLLRVVPHLEHLDVAWMHKGLDGHFPLQAMTPACSTFPKLKTLYFGVPSTDFTFNEVNQLLAFVSGSTDLEVKFYHN
ncbi:hypothetical protein C8R42DRAFT_724018 [Lentinula raphanica]|nr:hypothetical protein C8R42DRAFT_724018 [Lentinula raphanica]